MLMHRNSTRWEGLAKGRGVQGTNPGVLSLQGDGQVRRKTNQPSRHYLVSVEPLLVMFVSIWES